MINKTITPDDLEAVQVVNGIVNGEPLTKVAKNLGISRTKLYRLITTDTAQDAIATAYYQSLDQITYQMPNLVKDALNALGEVSNSRQCQQWRTSAALAILERFDKLEKLHQQ